LFELRYMNKTTRLKFIFHPKTNVNILIFKEMRKLKRKDKS